MAINPLLPQDERYIESEPEIQPSRTYALDFDNNEMGGIIDGEQAIRQFIRKAIMTARFRFLIYDDEYGCELEDLIGADVTDALLQTEIPRVITDALIYDDRIENVSNFVITRKKDMVFIEFTVTTTDGTIIDEEVTLIGA